MPQIIRKLNHRNICLDSNSTTESIGVLTRAGEYRYVSWLGFIEREEALSADARPVRLEAFAYALDEGFGADRIELKSGQHIQGCLVHGGVYGVVVGGVLRVV